MRQRSASGAPALALWERGVGLGRWARDDALACRPRAAAAGRSARATRRCCDCAGRLFDDGLAAAQPLPGLRGAIASSWRTAPRLRDELSAVVPVSHPPRVSTVRADRSAAGSDRRRLRQIAAADEEFVGASSADALRLGRRGAR